MADPKVKRVLMSVTDKTGVVEFARALSEEFGAQIISTGGTARVIAEAGIPVTPIDEVTQFPEMMDGRVKTLHPAVHGGLLAKRDNPEHMAQAAEHGIEMIDMVVVNLYAFEKTVESGADFGTCIENIDIGGPSMLRSAAKNFASVAVVTDPASYGSILAEMRANDGATTLATRTQLALRVFQTTNAYDGAIAAWLGNQLGEVNELFLRLFLLTSLSSRVFVMARTHTRALRSTAFLSLLRRILWLTLSSSMAKNSLTTTSSTPMHVGRSLVSLTSPLL